MENFTIVHLTALIFSIAFAPFIIKQLQLLYYKLFNKIFFVHFYLFKKKLNKQEIDFLHKNVNFYNKLNKKEKEYFNHRVVYFLNNLHYNSRLHVVISKEMKLFIASTAVTLTFGFRNYKLSVLNNIIIYPNEYLSKNSGKKHKGEFNPKLKTLVFSWEDFLSGFDSLNDNINLGIHEFSHVLHSNSLIRKDVNSMIFISEYNTLLKLIKEDKRLKKKIIRSKYFRDYAFHNQFELLAVLLEHFIETPKDLKDNFPKIYSKIKKMLNFNFGNY